MGKSDDIPFDIMQIVSLLNIQIKRPSGSSVYVNCPFCTDTRGRPDTKRHMNVHPEKNVWRCNRCGRSGGKLALYAEFYGIDTKEAYKQLMDSLHGKQLPEQKRKVPVMCSQRDEPVVVAPVEVRHLVYSELMKILKLASIHRKALLARGLTVEAIEQAMYRSVPIVGSERITAKMISFGLKVENVPGFYYDSKKGIWDFYAPASGILIPVRNRLGMIQGMQVRYDNPITRKYMWLTSNDLEKGVPASSYIHLVGKITRTMYLTEGPLKADVAHCISGLPFIAVAGVTALSGLPDLLQTLYKLGVRTIAEALDMDKLTNDNVRDNCLKLHEMVKEAGMICKSVQWDPRYKGIDDYYFNEKEGKSA